MFNVSFLYNQLRRQDFPLLPGHLALNFAARVKNRAEGRSDIPLFWFFLFVSLSGLFGIILFLVGRTNLSSSNNRDKMPREIKEIKVRMILMLYSSIRYQFLVTFRVTKASFELENVLFY